MTVGGMRPLKPAEPVCNLSYYEAETFATCVGARLPTESEWDHAAATLPVQGRFVEDGWLHPRPAPETTGGLRQIFGDLWEWTGFAYLPYPGYRPPRGHWANTTASSCAARWSYGAAPAPPRPTTSG